MNNTVLISVKFDIFKDRLENFFDRILFICFNVSHIFIGKTLSFERFRCKTIEKHIKQSEN